MVNINKKVLGAALIFALISAVSVFAYVNMIKKAKSNIEYTDVIIAARDIERKAAITEADLKTIKIVKENANPRVVSNTIDIIGKMARDKIYSGEQVISDRIQNDSKTDLSFEIPEGKRAVSVNVNEASSVGNFIRPGDYVDVLATFEKFEVDANGVKTVYNQNTKIILQNIMILGIGQQMEVPEKGKTETPKTVTFAVTAEDAEKLVYGEEAGVLRMALRKAGDKNVAVTQGIIGEDLVSVKSRTQSN
ncbi:hypothetical protein LAD12857_34480 [Lacrimispora amygdalina]|uniref:SAF domain-containing protein n=1 Tax=Lacrimispora amygdalina TaxID=253257 RepID=A0ABQ5M994_9FIRM